MDEAMDDVAELAHWHQWIDTLKAILAEEIRDEARHKASTAKQQKTLLDSFKPSSPSKKEKKKKVVHASSSGAKFPGHGNVLSPTKPAPLSEKQHSESPVPPPRRKKWPTMIMWECGTCERINDGSLASCNACDAPRP